VKKFLALVALIWLVLLPPLFTDGGCTREFEDEQARIGQDLAKFRNANRALAYWKERGIVPRMVSVDNCRRAKPRDRLERTSVDMRPFYSLPIPGVTTIHWAK
jgi:hypothetical protein